MECTKVVVIVVIGHLLAVAIIAITDTVITIIATGQFRVLDIVAIHTNSTVSNNKF